jgi:hypothetical protein
VRCKLDGAGDGAEFVVACRFWRRRVNFADDLSYFGDLWRAGGI